MKDIKGQKFGRLTAIEFSHRNNNLRYYWKFVCECGKEVIIQKSPVMRGTTQSCGCLHTERFHNTRHSLHGTRFYSIWVNIRSRCFNKNVKSFSDYGSRGIKCLWNNFNEFKEDMYNSYQVHVEKFGERDTQIDRIDFDGNYSRQNCRWVTWKEQATNKKRVKKLTYRGVTAILPEWAKTIGIKYKTLHWRINHGWSIEKALTKEVI